MLAKVFKLLIILLLLSIFVGCQVNTSVAPSIQPESYPTSISQTNYSSSDFPNYIVMDRYQIPKDIVYDNDYDIGPILHKAKWIRDLGNGVFIFPTIFFGDTRYTNHEIEQMLYLSPEEKREKISTFYEAVQLYMISGFGRTLVHDNIHVMDGHHDWEFHKLGYYAVKTNTGCCATKANWFNYMLSDDYETYVMHILREHGGHMLFVIHYNEWWIVIDPIYITKWNILDLGDYFKGILDIHPEYLYLIASKDINKLVDFYEQYDHYVIVTIIKDAEEIPMSYRGYGNFYYDSKWKSKIQVLKEEWPVKYDTTNISVSWENAKVDPIESQLDFYNNFKVIYRN